MSMAVKAHRNFYNFFRSYRPKIHVQWDVTFGYSQTFQNREGPYVIVGQYL